MTAGPRCTLPAGATRRRCTGTTSAVGGALRFSAASTTPATDLAGVTGAYPLDVDGDGIVDLAVLRVGENVLLRGLGDCRFERGERGLVVRRRRRLDRRRSARPGRARRPCRPWPSATTSARRGRQPTSTAPTTRSSGRPPTGTGYGAADRRWRPGWCTLSMLFSDWDRSGRRDLRVSNDRHYYRRRRGAALADRAGRSRRACTPPPTAGSRRPDLGHGHRQLRRDRRRLSGGLPDEPGRQQAPDADRPGRASRPTATSRSSAASSPPSRSPAATPCRRPPGTPSSRTSTTTASSTCSSPRATSTRMPDYAAKDPSNLLLGQPDGTFVEGADSGRDRRLRARPRRGARRPQPRRAARPRRGRTTGRPSSSGGTSAPATPAAPAPMGHWLALRLREPGPEPRRDRGWLEVRVGDRRCGAS